MNEDIERLEKKWKRSDTQRKAVLVEVQDIEREIVELEIESRWEDGEKLKDLYAKAQILQSTVFNNKQGSLDKTMGRINKFKKG